MSWNMKQVDEAYTHRDGDTDEYHLLLEYPVTHYFFTTAAFSQCGTVEATEFEGRRGAATDGQAEFS